jgi:hypothetical protein
MRSTCCFLAFSFLSLVALPAAQAAGAGSQERLAQKACLSGNVQKGVEILSDLYIETKNPLFIYNQGRCFEQNGRCQDAIPRFKEYLRKATKASAEDRAEARQHIADCEAGLDRKAVAPQPEPQPPPATVPAAPPGPLAPQATEPLPAPIAAVQQTAESVQVAGDTAGSAGSGLRITGLVVGAVGVAALVAGVVLNLKHNSMIDELQDHYDRSRDDTAQTYGTLTVVSYGAGAACVAGGAILYYLGWRTGHRAQIVPTANIGSVGAAITGAF